ncbi:hypothetical protein BN8_p06810 (plasmid) [Fibrisoma limi BUZ 3]|uniref:Uncharacterized protein n=1 Tax=Fibrisoma limi BUZ 3 TaxID=1185876 RepID=I2GU13_9BACT|nr:DUF3970 family protein [Fibrisoma limi]CCH57614.1 hypothetical protein BN8_p06810 [Fibrisoma limi BUZ 3]
MTRIRIESDTIQEVRRAIELFTTVYDCIDFSEPQKGKNPKYVQRPKFFSYGELKEPTQQ